MAALFMMGLTSQTLATTLNQGYPEYQEPQDTVPGTPGEPLQGPLQESAPPLPGDCCEQPSGLIPGLPVCRIDNAGAVNVRTGPEPSFAAITSLPYGEPVSVDRVVYRDRWGLPWSKIYTPYTQGWVASRYLSCGGFTIWE